MTVVFKKNSIIKLNGYPDIEYKEDIALWIKSWSIEKQSLQENRWLK